MPVAPIGIKDFAVFLYVFNTIHCSIHVLVHYKGNEYVCSTLPIRLGHCL
jgi:hypothetical protein